MRKKGPLFIALFLTEELYLSLCYQIKPLEMTLIGFNFKYFRIYLTKWFLLRDQQISNTWKNSMLHDIYWTCSVVHMVTHKFPLQRWQKTSINIMRWEQVWQIICVYPCVYILMCLHILLCLLYLKTH